ncbi:hypothetical protein TM239_64880 [Bradyrhizobium sp. TM239]|nr:hypothetical protein TM239_64880 [Bradyrhizobium sp. TM239]
MTAALAADLAARAEELPDPARPPLTDIPPTSDPRADSRMLELAVRLASLLRRPIDYIDPHQRTLTPLDPGVIGAMADHPAFRAPINRAIAGQIGFDAVPIDDAMLGRLLRAPSSRLAVVILTAPMDEVAHVARLVAAAILSRRIRGTVMKADRERIRDALGDGVFEFAIQEVPVLYPALRELDLTSRNELLQPTGEHGTVGQIEQLGMAALGGFLDSTEPSLAGPFTLRLPPATNYAGRTSAVGRFETIHCDQIVKIVRRRQQSWSAIID